MQNLVKCESFDYPKNSITFELNYLVRIIGILLYYDVNYKKILNLQRCIYILLRIPSPSGEPHRYATGCTSVQLYTYVLLLRPYEITSVTTGVVAMFVWPQPKGSPGERSPSEQVQISEKIRSIYAHWRRLPASWNRIDGEAWSWDSRCLPRKRLIFIR